MIIGANFPHGYYRSSTDRDRKLEKNHAAITLFKIVLLKTMYQTLQTPNIRIGYIFVYTYVMLCAIWYHLYNLKNVENIHGGVLYLVKLQDSANLLKITLGVFHVFKLSKWYQIAQSPQSHCSDEEDGHIGLSS